MFSAQVHTYFFAVFAAAQVLITVIKSRIVQENISDDKLLNVVSFYRFQCVQLTEISFNCQALTFIRN